MANECIYYCFKEGDYHCSNVNKDITDSGFVKKYCWNYGYGDCPIYKGNSSGSGCYLTTACVEAKGLPDDCRELEALRGFRDAYLGATAEGSADIQRYYQLAPRLVKQLDRLLEKQAVYQRIYNELVYKGINGANPPKGAGISHHDKYEGYMLQYLARPAYPKSLEKYPAVIAGACREAGVPVEAMGAARVRIAVK